MNRQQNAYYYPQVPPAPSQQQPRLQIDTHDNRFSFMPAQIEPETRHYSRDIPAYTTVPPLPLLPHNLNMMGEERQQAAPVLQQMTQTRAPEDVVQPDLQHEYLPHSNQSGYASDIKKDVPHRPDPIKITTQNHRSRMSIGPDENPLSPSTAPYTPMWTSTTTNMSIVLPSPNRNIQTSSYTPATPAPQVTHGGSWTHSLCSCAEPSICMTSLFCPCIVYGRTQYRLSLRSEKKDATNMLGYDSVNGSCIAWSFLCGINGILTGLQRGRVRRTYEMESVSGSFFSDCLEGCCCCCCVLAQNEKEIKYREETSRKTMGATTGKNEGYVPPGGMVFGLLHQPSR